MNQINFTANFVQNTTIKKKEKSTSEAVNTEVALVELDPNDKNDIKTIEDLSYDWGYLGTYIGSIYSNMVKEVSYEDVEKEHYYAVTTQENNFDKLDPNRILGVMLFLETTPDTELNEIKYIEVNPSTNRTLNRNRKYIGVGSSMLKFLFENYKQKPIYARSDVRATKFYENNNLTHRNDHDFRSFYHEI